MKAASMKTKIFPPILDVSCTDFYGSGDRLPFTMDDRC